MLYRTTRALAYPASIALLCCFASTASPRPIPAQPEPVIVPEPSVVPEPPRLVAVDRRIARRINALKPSVKERLVRVIDKLPKKVTLLVTSAARTREEQAALRPTFGIKARPGTSTHELGRAVDVNVLVDGVRVSPRRNHQIIGAAMKSEGFRHLGPADPVHYSLPEEEVDPLLMHGPDLQVPTMADIAAQREPALPAVLPLPAPLAGTSQSAASLATSPAE